MRVKKDDMKLVNLWWVFIDTACFVAKARQKELSKYGITMEQAGTLSYIRDHGDNVRSAEIVRQRRRERNTVSEALDAMARKGLIKKLRSTDKKNQIIVQLTDKGKMVAEKSRTRESINWVFSCLSDDELIILRELCNKMSEKALEIIGMEKLKERP